MLENVTGLLSKRTLFDLIFRYNLVDALTTANVCGFRGSNHESGHKTTFKQIIGRLKNVRLPNSSKRAYDVKIVRAKSTPTDNDMFF